MMTATWQHQWLTQCQLSIEYEVRSYGFVENENTSVFDNMTSSAQAFGYQGE